jgi:hypothetical protein
MRELQEKEEALPEWGRASNHMIDSISLTDGTDSAI